MCRTYETTASKLEVISGNAKMCTGLKERLRDLRDRDETMDQHQGMKDNLFAHCRFCGWNYERKLSCALRRDKSAVNVEERTTLQTATHWTFTETLMALLENMHKAVKQMTTRMKISCPWSLKLHALYRLTRLVRHTQKCHFLTERHCKCCLTVELLSMWCLRSMSALPALSMHVQLGSTTKQVTGQITSASG